MAVISVEVPDKIAKKFAPYSIVKWSDLTMEEQLSNLDGDGWETVVDFGKGVNGKEILSYLEKIMVKNWQKQLDKFSHIFGLNQMINDILLNNISNYDVKKLSGYIDLYRLRKGKIRIILRKKLSGVDIVKIDTRGDIYKGL